MYDKDHYYIYAYVTRHGVNSETAVLHVGYSHSNSNDGYPTWFSKPLDEKTAKAIYESIKHYDGSHFSTKETIANIVEDLIEDYKEK